LTTLARFEEIFPAKPGTDENDEADVLALIIREYEETHFAIEAPVL
jgi:HTH-type transcriptional regulator / antitoxin HigA